MAILCKFKDKLWSQAVSFCEFIVYTQKDIFVQRIYPEVEFMKTHQTCDFSRPCQSLSEKLTFSLSLSGCRTQNICLTLFRQVGADHICGCGDVPGTNLSSNK